MKQFKQIVQDKNLNPTQAEAYSKTSWSKSLVSKD